MKVPRDVDGRALVKVLCRNWDYRVMKQEGSHIILQTETPTHHRLPIPDHSPLRVGTLAAILRIVATHRGVEREAILRGL